NKATLDYYNYTSGRYSRDIFPKFNPGTVKEMGDVGNDLGIYGSKLYAVINCSNKIDVIDKNTFKKTNQIDIPNCRYITFYKGYAYVSSYVGPVSFDEGARKQLGAVFKIDTTTMQIVDKCVVGRQPDGITIAGNKLYVANSGGYDTQNYENTISVIDLETFSEEEKVPIAINLQYCISDRRGVLWISSRGDYYETSGKLVAYDTRKRRIVAEFDVPVGSMWLDDDNLYIINSQWSYISQDNQPANYIIVDTKNMMVTSKCFITDGTQNDIRLPYGIAVNPITKDILVTDALQYVTPGWLFCYNTQGVLQWKVRTGDIPAHIAFNE
ncbi:MAG: YncE family protein, partial [Muribaculaceae bacterium]|nr:YncE family protein [Muribaculaceae bacterium]